MSHETPGTTDWNERAICEGLRQGDDQAFELVFRRYGARMLATARRLLGNDEDARDAVQEAMLAAFKGAGRFEGGSQVGTWLHRIVVNAALMRLRTRRRKPEASIDDLLPSYTVDGHRALPANDELPVDEILVRAEQLALLRACVDGLPDGYRQVYILREIEELSSEEVATAMGLTANAVKIRLHRARQAVMGMVKERLAARG